MLWLWLVELSETVLPAIVIAVLINLFLAQATRVYGHSMEPNLHTDQRLVVEKVSYRLHGPRRGDVVVLRMPERGPELLIKRVIAMTGETIGDQGRHGFHQRPGPCGALSGSRDRWRVWSADHTRRPSLCHGRQPGSQQRFARLWTHIHGANRGPCLGIVLAVQRVGDRPLVLWRRLVRPAGLTEAT